MVFFFKLRESGRETFGAKIWWNSLRPIHSLLYFMFAYYAITQNSHAWKFLAADVSFGLLAFIYHHYNAGSFQKLM